MQLVRLTSDRIVDLSRFVAILPNEENHCYSLILEGSDCADAHAGERDIPIDRDDLNILTKYLNEPKIATQTQYNLADLVKPQAVAILQARIARHETMSDEESAVRAAARLRQRQSIPDRSPSGCFQDRLSAVL